MRRFSSGRAAGGRALLVCLLALLLGACATLPQPSAPDGAPARAELEFFTLEARFALRHDERSYSGLLSWRHLPARDEMFLASPLGQGMAEIVSDADGARLTGSDGKVHAAADVAALTEQVLGFPLPLERLSAWVLGRSGGSGRLLADAQGRPSSLAEDGWLIGYEYADDDPQALPIRLLVERPGTLELRLRIDEWGQGRAQARGRGDE